MTELEFIQKWLGAPWVDRGDTTDGIDCWGLAVEYYKEIIGIELKAAIDFTNIETGYLEEVRSGNWVESDSPCKGLVFMCFVGDRPTHCGICLDSRNVLHCPGSPSNHGSVSVHSIKAIQKVYGKMRFYQWQE